MSWDVGAWVVNTLKNFILKDVITRVTHGSQEFTVDGIFTVPIGVTGVLITACGGGGGGSGGDTDSYSSGCGGNGAECIVRKFFPVTPGQQIPITIGLGGAAGTSGISKYTAGSAGTSTVIGSLITLRGGAAPYSRIMAKKPTASEDTRRPGGGFGGGGGTNEDDLRSDGEDGAVGLCGFLGVGSYPGGGGGGSLGNGGHGGSYSSNGGAKATDPGPGGGGGGASGRNTNYTASNGGNGKVIIEW